MDHELKSEVDPSEFYHLKEEDTAFRNKNTHSIHTKKNLSSNKLSNSELRRITHIQSEQKRRAQIKDGFEELRSELPSYINKKMSKVVLLQRTVQHIKHLKSTHIAILGELERIAEENSRLRKFQNNVLQNQSMESMYHAHTNSSSNSSSRSSSSGSSG
ncbi:hypothetical protein BDB01DRAFT_720189 [Pilobolus umbonatus]|nr:hypothetical protein BDB01DRAFT_720189 [Pilobolus umbonatus]